MNAIMERWVKTLRGEFLDRTLIWNKAHLRHALQAYEQHYNQPAPTDPSPPQHPCEHGSNPLDLTGSNAARYSDGTVSVESSTSIGMPLDLCGRNFRHAQA